jgi:hypothetical protein
MDTKIIKKQRIINHRSVDSSYSIIIMLGYNVFVYGDEASGVINLFLLLEQL